MKAYIKPDRTKSVVLISTRARSLSSAVGSHLAMKSQVLSDSTAFAEGTRRARSVPSPVCLLP